MQNGRQQLRELMQEHLSLADLKLICFDLGIGYDHLSGDTVPVKVVSLVEMMEKRQRLPDLLKTLREHRPRTQWPDEASLQSHKGGSRTAPTSDEPEINQALHAYCRDLLRQCGRLPLRGLDLTASDPASEAAPPSLANVYIALNTTATIPKDGRREMNEEREPLPALQATLQNRALVLCGDPGGGKTTFLNHLAYTLAQQFLDGNAVGTTAVPLLITLREFAATLPTPTPAPEKAQARDLWQFIADRLTAKDLSAAIEPLHNLLTQGKLFLLLDGLDELPTPEQRLFVRQALLQFQARHDASRYLVTCRTLAYQPPSQDATQANAPDLRLPLHLFPVYTLAPLTLPQIDHFVEAWYTELERVGKVQAQDRPDLTRQLQQAIRRSDLAPLAPNPLLLTVMAIVHTHRGRLPSARALLYEESMDILLWHWEQEKSLSTLRTLLSEANRAETDLKRLLGELAFQAHDQGSERGVADIGQLALLKALARLKTPPDLNWAQKVVDTMKERAGLLVETSPTVFTFPHRTFQEYLAGAHLGNLADFVERADKLAAGGAKWREVILLAVGRLVYLVGQPDRPLALVAELCPAVGRNEDSAWRKVWLAGDVLREMGLARVQDSELGRNMLARVQARLAQLVSGGYLPPQERAEAGDVLGWLGDPRRGVVSLEPEMISIPAGPFLMGEEKYTVTLPAFAIAKYATTNAQYRFFVEAGGYTNPTYWTKEGWAYCQEEGWQAPRFWEETGTNAPNQPVVGVSWVEAMAYAAWLRHQTGQPYRLPTEAEWERAARHTDGRSYPWGNELIEDCANYDDLNLRRTTAVGLFPQGAAQCGALDLAGNVWEWCQTRWDDENEKQYPEPYTPDDGRENPAGGNRVTRILHGGSLVDSERYLHCAYRGWNHPPFVKYLFGFRVCVSLFF